MRKPPAIVDPTAVRVTVDEIIIPTYLPAPPNKNPMFLEKRVYQGSSGKVYPLPFTDRISEKPVDRAWKAIRIENEFLRALILPEIGGRIHALQDKTNGYDLIYNQAVIKPALVGLAGPWISGGIEFNWPQHHRPATFLPVDFEIEERPDGSKIVWCGDHDPMTRMKGMHGVCLHPGCAFLELKVRAHNRTPFTQTFLWWANVATRVHESYQSFFPPDVFYVADHARRSMSEYPFSLGRYYGVNYGERARRGTPKAEYPRQFVAPHCGGNASVNYAPNDLSFYANIPVPTSYMSMGSKEDFFGGYDHAAQAGLIHYANHHISPGKKQWTWGNHEFGYAWDRNLTDPDAKGECAPYIEIMAGVYTDNQPDFSFLQPGETKTWSQYWYPIQKIGPAQAANLDAALSLRRVKTGAALGVAVTRPLPRARVSLRAAGKLILDVVRDLTPSRPFLESVRLPARVAENDLRAQIADASGAVLLAYQPASKTAVPEVPPPAREPSAPEQIASADELYLTGLHLEQYRHATRSPVPYWQEAIRRDPSDSRCNNALGLWRLRRGEFALAEPHFRRAIERVTRRNANPYDGESYYNLALCLRCLARDDDAYDAFYKATWNQAWAGASCHALAEIDCVRRQWASALVHINRSLRFDIDNLRARDLKALLLRQLGEGAAGDELLRETLALDPLDWWARQLRGQPLRCDAQTRLDLAHDYARAGFFDCAISVLAEAESVAGDLPDQSCGAAPLVLYTLGWLHEKRADAKAARAAFALAASASPDYCFPARLEEISILEAAMRANPKDPRAPYYLGNLLYDRRRHEEAIVLWERSVKSDPSFAVAWRNLGIGYFNMRKKPAKALAAYEKAFAANPRDARVFYERDQLWKRLGRSPARRLREHEHHPALVEERDDLSVEFCALLNAAGRHGEALAVLQRRRFQPWEGGEGGPLGQYVRARVALGRCALREKSAAAAREHFEAAFRPPDNLGEARHLLVNQSDLHYWLGCACAEFGERKTARKRWLAAASFQGDFQEMSVRAFSEMTYFSALSWIRLGRPDAGCKLLRGLLAYAITLEKAPAQIDYFATSLPTMLLFEDDLSARQQTTALFLQAQAYAGLGRMAKARALLRRVLQRDPSHAAAADLLRDLPR